MPVEFQTTPPDATEQEPDYIARKGRHVVLGFWTKVPPRCFVCNKEAHFGEHVECEQLNHIEVFFCEEHITKRKRQFKYILAYAAVCLLCLITAGFLKQSAFGTVAFAAILLVPILYLPHSITAKFKQRRIWIKGAGKAFLNSLPVHTG